MENGPLPLIKIYDFSVAKDRFEDSAPRSQIGTALFTAPEVFLNVQGHAYEGDSGASPRIGNVAFPFLSLLYPNL